MLINTWEDPKSSKRALAFLRFECTELKTSAGADRGVGGGNINVRAGEPK